jgi:hypothetical protein
VASGQPSTSSIEPHFDEVHKQSVHRTPAPPAGKHTPRHQGRRQVAGHFSLRSRPCGAATSRFFLRVHHHTFYGVYLHVSLGSLPQFHCAFYWTAASFKVAPNLLASAVMSHYSFTHAAPHGRNLQLRDVQGVPRKTGPSHSLSRNLHI